MELLSDKIKRLESSYDLNQIKLVFKDREFEVYPWVKPYIFNTLQFGNRETTNAQGKWYQVKKLLFGFRRIFKKPETVFFSSSMERRLLGEKVYDKLFHEFSIDNNLGVSKTIELQLPASSYERSEYANSNVVSRSFMLLAELIYTKLFLRKLTINNVDVLYDFCDLEKVPRSKVIYGIKKNLAQYKIMKLWLRLNPKLKRVFLSVSYTNFGRILACKERQVLVVECQHGVINKEHYGYSYYYHPLTNQFPDYLLTFGKADCQFMINQPISNFTKPFSLGSFILNYYNSQSIQKDEITTISSVAVSLQDCETGVASVDSFIELAKLNPKVQFYFKRRSLPSEFYSRYELPANIQFEEKRNVYELIVDCDLHLTAYSSCALEALTLGRPNILFNLNDKAQSYYAGKLPASYFNHYCNSVKEMNEALTSMRDLSTAEIKKSNVGNFETDYSVKLNQFVELITK